MRILAFLVLTLLAFLTPSLAKEEKSYGNLELEVLKVYDGDTLTANVKDYPPIIGESIGIRLNGIDTPEMKDSNPRVKAHAVKARNSL